MTSIIYKITNDINEKVYVGKTTLTIEERFKMHCRDCYKRSEEKRPLYAAMRKYGKEHFKIEKIEECDSNLSSEREQYWIGFYKGFEEGYNATLGGDGKILYDYNFIEELLREGKTAAQISEQIGCCKDIVYKVAKNNNLSLKRDNELKKQMKASQVKVAQYELTGEFIQLFDSYSSAAKWLYENGKIKKITGGVRSHIGEVCNGTRKSAYKYKWQKWEE